MKHRCLSNRRRSPASPMPGVWVIWMLALLLLPSGSVLGAPAEERDPDPTKRPPAPRVGREVRRFNSQEGGVHGIALTPDGKQVLSGGGGLNYFGPGNFRLYDCTVRLWDVATGKELRRFEGTRSPIWSVALSPDGRRAISTSGDVLMKGRPFDCVIRLWDVGTAKELRQFEGHEEPVWTAVFSPNGTQILSGAGNFKDRRSSDCTVRLWDVRTGKELRCFEGHTNRVYSLAFLPRGQAVSASADRTLRVWDLQTGREVRRLQGHTNTVHGLAVSPDGQRIASASWDATVRLWGVETGKELLCLKGHESLVMCVAFSPDGKLLASGGYDHTIRLWDAKRGRPLGVFRGHNHQLRGLAFASDGIHLFSGASDTSTRLWDISREAR